MKIERYVIKKILLLSVARWFYSNELHIDLIFIH